MQKIILGLIAIIVITLTILTQIEKDTNDTNVATIIKTKIINEPKKVENLQKPTLKAKVTHTSITPFRPKLKPISSTNTEVQTQSLEMLNIESFKFIQPKINAEVLKLPECLEAAETKEEAFRCNDKLRELHKELAMAMGDFSENNITGYDDTFVWNEESKINMIKEIENSTQEMQEMQTCIDVANTEKELNQCFQPPQIGL